ncbi:hypothetical protein GCM10027076_23000 [Nocardioides montaniterrae]
MTPMRRRGNASTIGSGVIATATEGDQHGQQEEQDREESPTDDVRVDLEREHARILSNLGLR